MLQKNKNNTHRRCTPTHTWTLHTSARDTHTDVVHPKKGQTSANRSDDRGFKKNRPFWGVVTSMCALTCNTMLPLFVGSGKTGCMGESAVQSFCSP